MSANSVQVEEISKSVSEVVVAGKTMVLREIELQVTEVAAQGPRGPAGASNATVTFNQASPASTWSVEHNLGKFPSVTVVDSAGDVVSGEIQYVDSNSLVLYFSAPFSGKAYLN